MNGPEAAKEAGVTFRQLDFWCSQGYLGDHLKQSGTGHARYFYVRDRTRLECLAALVRAGVRVQIAAEIVGGDSDKYLALKEAVDKAWGRTLDEAWRDHG